MRNILALSLLVLILFATSVAAFGGDVYVRGYTRSDGTYVAPHWRSAPDGNPWNNYSTKGNVNPYTGREGTRDPFGSSGLGINRHSDWGSSFGFGNGGFGSGYGSGFGTRRR